MPETTEIFDTLNANQGVMVALEKSLEMVAGDDKLKSFLLIIKHSYQILPKLLLKILRIYKV